MNHGNMGYLESGSKSSSPSESVYNSYETEQARRRSPIIQSDSNRMGEG